MVEWSALHLPWCVPYYIASGIQMLLATQNLYYNKLFPFTTTSTYCSSQYTIFIYPMMASKLHEACSSCAMLHELLPYITYLHGECILLNKVHRNKYTK